MKNVIGKGKFLSLVADGNWEYAIRNNATGAVVIVPLIEYKSFFKRKAGLILIEQFRPALNSMVLELPAGLVGDHNPHEHYLSAAQRELLEETGYECRNNNLHPLALNCPSSSGLTNETFHLILASGLKKVGQPIVSETENIKTVEVKLENIYDVIDSYKDKAYLISPKIFMALCFVDNGKWKKYIPPNVVIVSNLYGTYQGTM